MKNFKQWQENLGKNPNNDVDQYITGLTNRLMLLYPEEIAQRKEKLVFLKELLDRILG